MARPAQKVAGSPPLPPKARTAAPEAAPEIDPEVAPEPAAAPPAQRAEAPGKPETSPAPETAPAKTQNKPADRPTVGPAGKPEAKAPEKAGKGADAPKPKATGPQPKVLPTWEPPDEDASVRSDDWHIRVRGIHKTFGPHHVLRGVNLDIARGKINVIIGGSGQGKSVIMKHLMGLLKPDKGSIFVDGQDLVPLDDFGLNQLRKKFGMVFQYAALFDSLTVEENIVFQLNEHGDPNHDPKSKKRRFLSKAELHKIAVDQLDKLALPQVLLGKVPSELSGGQRKRVGLARALVMKPEILLYDEPTTGLDPVSTKNVDDMIRDVSKEHGVTSVIISHDMASTFRIGDRISSLFGGRIIESGPPEEIRGTRHMWLREFIGTSGAVQLDPVADNDLIDDEAILAAEGTPAKKQD